MRNFLDFLEKFVRLIQALRNAKIKGKAVLTIRWSCVRKHDIYAGNLYNYYEKTGIH